MGKSEPFLLAAGLGILAGMRSMSAPAVVSRYLAQHPDPAVADSPLRILNSPATATVLTIMAAGEMVVDKLPGIPPRTEGGALIARCLSGGTAGAAVGLINQEPVWPAALTGTVAAAFSAHLFYRVRKQAGDHTALPDAGWAVAEDALVVGLGLVLRRVLDNRLF